MEDVELALVVEVNGQRRAAFTLREDADSFVDIVCAEVELGDEIKLIVVATGEVLTHFDEDGNDISGSGPLSEVEPS